MADLLGEGFSDEHLDVVQEYFQTGVAVVECAFAVANHDIAAAATVLTDQKSTKRSPRPRAQNDWARLDWSQSPWSRFINGANFHDTKSRDFIQFQRRNRLPWPVFCDILTWVNSSMPNKRCFWKRERTQCFKAAWCNSVPGYKCSLGVYYRAEFLIY